MNETTKSDMIMIMHRLKRLIVSFYHQVTVSFRLLSLQAMQYGRVDHQATTV